MSSGRSNEVADELTGSSSGGIRFSLRRGVVCALAAHTVAVLLFLLAGEGRETVPVWPFGPFLLSVMLLGSRRDWLFLVPCTGVASAIANAVDGRNVILAVVYGVITMLVGGLGGLLLGKTRPTILSVSTPSEALRVVLAGVVIGLPLSTLAGVPLHVAELMHVTRTLFEWVLDACLFTVLAVPLAALAGSPRAEWWGGPGRSGTTVVFAIAIVVTVPAILGVRLGMTGTRGEALVPLLSSSLLAVATIWHVLASPRESTTQPASSRSSEWPVSSSEAESSFSDFARFLAGLRGSEASETGVLRVLAGHFPHGRVGHWAADAATGVFSCRELVNGSTMSTRRGVPVPSRDVERSLVNLRDGLVDSRLSEADSPLARRIGASVLAAPVRVRDRIIGLLALTSSDPSPGWTPQDRCVLLACAERLSNVQEARGRRRVEEQRRIIEKTAGVYVWQWDARGRITHASPGIERVLGLEAKVVLGQSIFDLLPEDAIVGFLHWLQQAAANGTPFESYEHRLIGANGRVVWQRITGEPIRGPNDEFAGFEGVAVDVTPQRSAAERLRASLREAEAASRAKDEFLANMSHEIRTPMTAILGYTDLLLDDKAESEPREERRERLKTIQRQGKYLLDILNDILDLAKIEAGKLEVERIEVDVNALVGEVVELMEVRARERNLELEAVPVGTVPARIQCDPLRLRQILVNLIGNAIKFTEEGGVTLEISCPSSASGHPFLQFDVVDTGIGMSDEQVGRLFQRFTQAEMGTTRKYGGTGLGLTISRRLAVMLGGDISVVSQPGIGSRFTVIVSTGSLDGVPMLRSFARSRQATMRARIPAELAAGCRLLLADDAPDNRIIIGTFLRGFDIAVTEAENGRMAVDKTLEAVRRHQPFDVILLDMQMPVMDGYTAARTLRAAEYEGPIIALTAQAMSSDRQKCLEAGCNEYATKPIDRQDLIRKVVAQFQATRARSSAPVNEFSATFAKT